MDINQLKEEVNSFKSEVINTLGDFQEYMDSEIKRIENENKVNGIVIDNKTFSQLINVLAYGVSCGTVDKSFYDGIIKLGMEQTKTEKKQSEESEKPRFRMVAVDANGNRISIDDDAMEFISSILNRR